MDSTFFVFFAGAFCALLAFVAFFVSWSHRRRQRMALLEIRPPECGRLLRPAGYRLQEKIISLNDEQSDRISSALVWAALAGAVVTTSIFVASRIAGVWATGNWSPALNPAAILTGVSLLAGMTCGVCAWRGGKRVTEVKKEIERHRLGLRGEQAVAEALQSPEVAGEGYFAFHDVPLDRGGNADHVVIGPGGVFVLETKARSQQKAPPGKKRNRLYFDGTRASFPSGQWDNAASAQAQANAQQIEGWLKAVVPQVKVQPCLVYPGWEVHLTSKGGLKAISSRGVQFYFQGLTSCFEKQELESMRAVIDRRCRDVVFQ